MTVFSEYVFVHEMYKMEYEMNAHLSNDYSICVVIQQNVHV